MKRQYWLIVLLVVVALLVLMLTQSTAVVWIFGAPALFINLFVFALIFFFFGGLAGYWLANKMRSGFTVSKKKDTQTQP